MDANRLTLTIAFQETLILRYTNQLNNARTTSVVITVNNGFQHAMIVMCQVLLLMVIEIPIGWRVDLVLIRTQMW